MDETNPIALAVKALRVRSGLSVRQIATAAGFGSPNAYTHYETRFKKEYLPFDVAKQLAEVMEGHGNPPIERAEVLNLAGPLPQFGSPQAALPAPFEPLWPPNARVAVGVRAPPVRLSTPRGTPVYGTAQGGPDGTFLLNSAADPVDYVRTPETLSGTAGAFAVYVEGDSMVPWKVEGQLLFINPHRKARIGDYVIITYGGQQPGRPPLTMVKKLVRRSASFVELEQYNPPKVFKIPADQVVSMFKVLELEDLFSV